MLYTTLYRLDMLYYKLHGLYKLYGFYMLYKLYMGRPPRWTTDLRISTGFTKWQA